MKKLLALALLVTGVTISAQTQAKSTYKIDEGSKTIYLDSLANQNINYVATGYVAMYKGNSYPVYQSAKGKKFIFMTSKKTGKQYRKYID